MMQGTAVKVLHEDVVAKDWQGAQFAAQSDIESALTEFQYEQNN